MNIDVVFIPQKPGDLNMTMTLELFAICESEEKARHLLYLYYDGFGTLNVHREKGVITSKTEVWGQKDKKKP